ncbi:MAG: AIPR family protein, partial [Novosphingobium sp.]
MIDLTYPNLLGHFPEHLAKGRSESASYLIWYLVNYYRLDPLEAVDRVCDQGGDRGIDGIFVNDNDQTITAFQSKLSQTENSSIGDGALRTFAGALAQLNSPEAIAEIIAKNGDGQLGSLLDRLNVIEKISAYEVRGEFLSNIEIDANGTSFLTTCQNINFVGRRHLTSSFISSKRDLPIATPAKLDVLGVEVAEYVVDGTTRVIVAPVKALDLINLDGISDQSLFSFNVRGPLGRTKVNKDIVASIKDSTKHKMFPLFHNGITIIADEFVRTDDALEISKYYVVNGCQSLSTLHDNSRHISSDLRLLVKIIRMDPQSKEAEEITRFSNNQNGVKARDWKSNDDTQVRLQNEIRDLYNGHYTYEIKTGEELPDGHKISNEEAGLLIMAFDLKEPWETHRKYEVWGDKYPKLFSRPDVTADRIVFLKIMLEAINFTSSAIKNELIRKYVLTKYMLMYGMRLVLETEIPELVKDPKKWVRDGAKRTALETALRGVAHELIVDLNYELKDLPDTFDYRGKLRDGEWVKLK